METLAAQGIINDLLQELAKPGGILVVAGNAATAIAIVILAFFIARILRSSVSRSVLRANRSANLASLLGNLARIGTYVAAAIVVLRIFGATWTSMVAAVGLLSLAVSLAIQDVLRSFVAGIWLLLERPFSIGDIIKVADVEGRVESVGVRTTVLRRADGVRMIVPNSTVFAQVVTEKSRQLQKLTLQLDNLPLQPAIASERIAQVVGDIVGVSVVPPPVINLQEIKGEKASMRVELWLEPEQQVMADVVLALRESFPGAEVSGKAGE